ncbi:thermonuclease family protein [Rhizobium sp. Leaf371]|uniref:thermonuclease family protein n=1 Tax=Rhizobium sp. Leaf371 TaxID=1736355 RepID=UPI000B2C24F7|nr:thermonuclease family protein [Rhizobium sp. Leaf371]
MIRRIICAITIFIGLQGVSAAADFTDDSRPGSAEMAPLAVVSGKVAVVDGRTLWFPAERLLVRLSQIDSCDLVQWSFNPNATSMTAASLAPVPCGALAKAWLKRTTGSRVVHCDAIVDNHPIGLTGKCRIGSRDLGLEMLRVGWARLNTPIPQDRRYLEAQQSAIAARYGMWGTYVLDMKEWRGKAIDTTLGRRPQADINLLRERGSEISPPFFDARRQPKRRDR